MQNLQALQTNRVLRITCNGNSLACLDVSNYKIQSHAATYRERVYTTQEQVDNAATVAGCMLPELPTTADFQEATEEVCAHAWHTLYTERQHYFLRKQSQLTIAVTDSQLTLEEQIEVLGWFLAHFQPTYTGHFTGGSRQLARILQTRMPRELQPAAKYLLTYVEESHCDLQRLIRYVVLKTQKLV